MNKFYITSAIPYVNAAPHIGHALEFIQADTIARYQKLLGHETLYLCGSDENALKNVQAAEKDNMPVQEFVDLHAKEFEILAKNLHIQFDVFQKGSSENHIEASQTLWKLCEASGDIYKKSYKGLYCLGCEEFKTPNDLNENGECPEHPGKKLEEVKEENYFFKLSKYQSQLIDLISSDILLITPTFRKNEILSFLKSGLDDFSISRSNTRAKNWGVPVPNDNNQRMYVWFDALNIYQSGIGFGSLEQNKKELYEKWWPADLHVIGKGIIRFHAVYWPAILLSAGLLLPKGIFVHEYFTVNGQKMSKTLGNVINPQEMINKYGTDALRYYCLAKISPFSDGDFSEEKLKEAFNADLANGLGNLVARVAKLCEKNEIIAPEPPTSFDSKMQEHLTLYKFNDALIHIWEEISLADKKINIEKPWELDGEKAKKILLELVAKIQHIAYNLQPFLPETSEKILKQFSGEITSQHSLFPRI
jgi:methionyl-tRNA synthetase